MGKKSSTTTRKLIRYLWLGFVATLVALPIYIFTVKSNLFNLYGGLPPLDVLENPESDLSSELYAADGVLLGKYFRQNRSPVDYEEISPHLVNALLVTEDYRFEKHAGVDLKGLWRVFFFSILLNQNTGGGSTLSQQLAKNLFKTRSEKYKGLLSKIPLIRTIVVKTKEWIVAVQLERAYTKKEILTMYLNTVEFGSNAFGLKVAAKTFFNTTPDSLSIEQAALLVGLLKAPSRYNPVKHPDNALKRRNLVIGQLHKYNFLTQEEYDSIRQLPLALVYKVENHTIGLATYFRSAIRDFLLKWTKDNGYDLFEDGLRIYTTIDSRMQQHAEEAVEEHMKELQKKFEQHWEGQNPWINEKGVEIKDFIKTTSENIEIYKNLVKEYGEGHDSVAIMMNTPEPMKLFSWEGEVDTVVSPIDSIKYNKRFLHAGFMAMDPHTGYVKAWVGGINYKFFKYDHVMQGKRQVGSAFKPIVYAAALDNGYTPCDEVVDAPVTFRMPGNPPIWTPKNASGRYTGQKMTLRQAMSRSVNSITAYLMKQLGPQRVVDYARKLGIMGPMEPVPALCLGASDVSVYELVGAYSTFVNDGVWTKPFYITRIEDREGNILQEFVPRKKEAISEETAYLMIHMLKGATEEEGGTARGLSKELREDNEIGGKTGTTSNHSDGWFVGITRDLTAGAWVGGEERCIHFRTLAEGQGARTARPIWEKFMLKIYEDPALPYEKAPFQKPSKPISVELDCDKPKEDSEKKDDNSLEQEVDSVEKKPDFQLDENEIF